MIGDLDPHALWYVMNHLRVKDRKEFEATLLIEGRVDVACERLWQAPGQKFQAMLPNGKPAVIGGFSPIWPGLCAGWLWGTADWPDVAIEVTSFVKHAILPQLRDKGIHRIECRPMVGNDDVQRWLKLVGFRKEAVVAQFGQGREDFYLYAWTALNGVNVTN